MFKEGNKTKTFPYQAKQKVNEYFFQPHQEQEASWRLSVACV